MKNRKIHFYDSFHAHIDVQRKPIAAFNFTYYEIIKVLNKYKNFFDDGTVSFELNFLDYGSGAGTLDFFIADKFRNNVVGLDVSPNAIKTAKDSQKNMRGCRFLNFYTLKKGLKEIKNKKFDIVLCLEVIEHVIDDKKLIKDLSKYLNKGGYLIISTPTVNAPLYKLGLTKSFDKRVGHLRRYKPESLVKYTNSIKGIKVVETKKIEGILRNSLFIFKPLGFLIKFIRGPITLIVSFVDWILVKLFGESNVIIVAKKI